MGTAHRGGNHRRSVSRDLRIPGSGNLGIPGSGNPGIWNLGIPESRDLESGNPGISESQDLGSGRSESRDRESGNPGISDCGEMWTIFLSPHLSQLRMLKANSGEIRTTFFWSAPEHPDPGAQLPDPGAQLGDGGPKKFSTFPPSHVSRVQTPKKLSEFPRS